MPEPKNISVLNLTIFGMGVPIFQMFDKRWPLWKMSDISQSSHCNSFLLSIFCLYIYFSSAKRSKPLPLFSIRCPGAVPQHNASLKVCICWRLSLILPQDVSKMFFSWSWAEHKIGSHTRVSLSYFREGGNGPPPMGGTQGGDWVRKGGNGARFGHDKL